MDKKGFLGVTPEQYDQLNPQDSWNIAAPTLCGSAQ